MSLRKWLGRQSWSPHVLGWPLSLWIRLCHATTQWTRQGDAEIEAALKNGPVILVLWHERIALSALHWRGEWGPISALHTTRFAGRVAGAVQAHLGTRPIAMQSRKGNLAASREVMRRLRGGVSVGITGDGPSGPVRELKDAPLEWARATGRPVFIYAFAMRRQKRLTTWDRLVWPRPFTQGAVVWRLWRSELPRRMDDATREAMRRDLEAALTAVADEAEALAQR
ncbi:DUF374 domain-containing protein [Rubellimicrobium rubrum]|uniref:DUF374 domain-containing protein n=1 Tax=Rubellimicrobium rubrum TaxID=2585369 RepID=A0A5C4MNR0_9RHOB|nr:DUF374 domain-containing protein [Rubellimicrobium rubrum]TNC46565.1 DUF374 domain-containing protein [Rubellimicrobium rubrum]